MARILVVDDNPDASRLLARLLVHCGHTSDAVDSGEAALAYLQRALPSLVILDLMMPGMDGNEVLRRIRIDPRTALLPVVIYSAVSDAAVRAHLLGKGAQDYWQKGSLDLADLNRRVEQLIQ